MYKQFKAATTIGAVMLALFSATPVLADNSSTFPTSAREFSSVDVVRTTPAALTARVDVQRTSTATTSVFPSSAIE